MNDRPLILFTLLVQHAVGMFVVLYGMILISIINVPELILIRKSVGWYIIPVLMISASFLSLFHLGKPIKAWRSIFNCKNSWLSREIIFAILFLVTSGFYAISLAFFSYSPFFIILFGGFSAFIGGILIYCMTRIYRIRTIPVWNTFWTSLTFWLCTLVIGITATVIIVPVTLKINDCLLILFKDYILVGLLVIIGAEFITFLTLIWWMYIVPGSPRKVLKKYIDQYHFIFYGRVLLLIISLILCLFALVSDSTSISILILLYGITLFSEILGRILFYEAGVRVGV